jgi:rubrerythrin
MKSVDTRERFQCNTCGETWIHTGEAICPFCGSDDTGPIEEPDEPHKPSPVNKTNS